MPYPIDSTFEARRDAGRLADAYLVDLYCLDGADAAAPIRIWNQPGTIAYPANDPLSVTNVVYASMYGRMEIDREIRFQAALATDPCKITFDAAAAGDDDDPIGEFTDSQWHQLEARVRQISLDPETMSTPSEPVWQWVGRMDFRQYVRAAGEPTRLVLTNHGGLFRIRGRNLRTRTHEDQQRRAPGDLFFQDVPKMVGQPLIFGKRPVEIRGSTSTGAIGPRSGYNRPGIYYG